MFRHSSPVPSAWPARYAITILTSATLVFAGSLAVSAPVQASEAELGPEVGGSGKALLDFVSTAREEALGKAPGLKPEVVTKILKHRAAGGKFRNLLELHKVTGITSPDLEAALAPYKHIDEGLLREAGRQPVKDASAASKSGGRSKTTDTSADSAATPNSASATGPIGAVRPGYYAKIPGYDDLDKIEAAVRTEFLERINAEQCPCGCQGETLAFCLVNDPGCAVVKGRVRKIYDDVTKKPSQ